jgi:hypothetical protein
MMYRKFKKFLRKHKCSRAFNRNVRLYYEREMFYTPEKHFLWLTGCTCPASILGTAFDWDKTSQGADFWLDLGSKWLKECSSI